MRAAGLPKNGVYVWGAGSLGRRALGRLRELGISVIALIDADETKVGKNLGGVEIRSPSYLASGSSDRFILVASQYYEEISRSLDELGYIEGRTFKRYNDTLDCFFTKPILSDLYKLWIEEILEDYLLLDPNSFSLVFEEQCDNRNNIEINIAEELKVLSRESSIFEGHENRLFIHKGCILKEAVRFSEQLLIYSSHSSYNDIIRLALLEGEGGLAIRPSKFAHTFYSESADNHEESEKYCCPQFVLYRGTTSARQISEKSVPSCIRSSCPRRSMRLEWRFMKRLLALGINPMNEALSDWWYSGASYLIKDTSSIDTQAPLDERNNGSNGIYFGVHKNGNHFFLEIAQQLVMICSEFGYTSDIVHENGPFPTRENTFIIVAPHEFFSLGTKFDFQENIGLYSLITTEQIHTPWFGSSIPVLKGARVIFDLNHRSTMFMRRLGLKSEFLPIGSKFSERKGGDIDARESLDGDFLTTWRERPIDITFVGGLTERRERFLTRNVDFCSNFKCHFHVPRVDEPLIKDSVDLYTQEAVGELVTKSKIVLAIHRDNVGYFEWHRVILQGLMYGSLVIIERCDLPLGLQANVHLIMADFENIQSNIRYYLTEGASIGAEIALAGHMYARNNFTSKRTVDTILSHIA
jgi:hypothetical protein